MNKRSTSVVTCTGSLSTPYASRGSRAVQSSDYPGAVRTSLVGRTPYSPITDPHLKNYYRNKFITALSVSRTKGSRTPVHVRPQSAPSVQSVSSYKVTVRTGHTGTSAKVYITLTGCKGRLLRQRLSKGGRKEMTFAPSSVEMFRVRGVDIGAITTVTVENEGLKVNDGWFLESVSVTNQDGEKWTCPFNQWLSLHHTDCQLIRQIKARPYTAKPPVDVCYSLKVHTGDVRGASTAANVFITVHGTKGSSPKTHLPGPFDRACVVEASLQAPDVGRVITLTVEHDNSGFGPDWFLDYISVSYKDTSSYYPCAQWLSRSEGDGMIQRTLASTPNPPQAYVGKSYIVTIVTGSRRGAGTQANVYLSLEGTVTSSGERRLDNDPDNYTRGRTDIFVINSCDLGTLTSATVRHDNTGPRPGWFLESVCVSCDDVEVCFPCGRWLELCGGCGGVTQVKLLPSDKETVLEEFKENHRYLVTMETGNRPGAATTANVYVILHGCHGDSGRLWLSGSSGSFASGAVDQFTVTSGVGGVGGVESVWVGHDNSGPSPGWFLKQVTVSGGDGVCCVCPCERWLCVDDGDGRIERELHPLLPSEDKGAGQGVWSQWTVHVCTSDMRGAGTDANVSIQIHGSHGDSSVIPLGDGVANFEQGEHDVFRDVGVCEDVGVVESVSVCHDGSRPYPDWHLERLVLINESTQDKYLCQCNKWLIANKDGTGGAKVKLTAVLQAPPPESTLMVSPQTTPTRSLTSQYVSQLRGDTTADTTAPLDSLPYTVRVLSGAPPLCDPAPFLSITLVGKEISTEPIRLQRLDSTSYVPGRPDTFSVQCLDIGPISRLKVFLEAPSHCPPWLIEQITIDSPTLGHTHEFPYGHGLPPGTEVMLEELANTGSSSLMVATNTHTQALTGYEMKVYTSDKKAAGTLNDLHLVLSGEAGDSQPVTVKNRSMFQRGQIDTLQIATCPIGPLKSLQVGHSPRGGRGSSLPWYLFQMVVMELSSGVKTTFPCRQWLPASQQGKPLNYTTLHKTQK